MGLDGGIGHLTHHVERQILIRTLLTSVGWLMYRSCSLIWQLDLLTATQVKEKWTPGGGGVTSLLNLFWSLLWNNLSDDPKLTAPLVKFKKEISCGAGNKYCMCYICT